MNNPNNFLSILYRVYCFKTSGKHCILPMFTQIHLCRSLLNYSWMSLRMNLIASPKIPFFAFTFFLLFYLSNDEHLDINKNPFFFKHPVFTYILCIGLIFKCLKVNESNKMTCENSSIPCSDTRSIIIVLS